MNMSLTSGKFVTNLMTFFCDHCLTGLNNLKPEAMFLVWALGIIALCIHWSMYFGELGLKDFIVFALKIGFFTAVIKNWQEISIDVVFESFKKAGMVAAGVSTTADPSDVISKGIWLSSKVMATILDTTGWMVVMGGLSYLLITLLFCLVVYCCFGFMAMQVFLVNVEYYIFVCLSVILIPFGVIKQTSFLSQRVFSGMFSYGMKIMVLTFIMGLGMKIFNKWTEPVPSIIGQVDTLVQAAFGTLVFAFLVWKIPNIAAGMITGTPSLEAGDAIRGARAVGGAAVTAASMGLAATGAVAAAAGAAQGTNWRSKTASFARNLGVAGYEGVKQAAFGNNFIKAHNFTKDSIAKWDANKANRQTNTHTGSVTPKPTCTGKNSAGASDKDKFINAFSGASTANSSRNPNMKRTNSQNFIDAFSKPKR